jgi:hypothetical protein
MMIVAADQVAVGFLLELLKPYLKVNRIAILQARHQAGTPASFRLSRFTLSISTLSISIYLAFAPSQKTCQVQICDYRLSVDLAP